jgi:CO/xanthine dehydrogenase FAD-binding subunit
MIKGYHRPRTVEEAFELISRVTPRTLPLGGGTLLSHGRTDDVEVVDLQDLGMNRIEKRGNVLEVGATTTLQQLMEHPDCPATISQAIRLEAPINIRNAASVAGTLVVCDGRSTLATVLLALDAKLSQMGGKPASVSIGEFLAMRKTDVGGYLITGLEVFLGVQLAFDYVARTPADKPIVAVALARWKSGRTRLALGGFGPSPLLAMDGTEPAGMESAARNAFHDASDPWGSAAYRMDVAATLAHRCLDRLTV